VTGDVDATFARTYREGDLLAFSDGTVLRARWQPTFYGLLRLTPVIAANAPNPHPGASFRETDAQIR
jgi:hypothetical protein